MNHIYKSLWSMALGTWVAVPENARTHQGAASSASSSATTRHVWRRHSLALAIAMVWGSLAAAPVYAQCIPQTRYEISCSGSVEGYESSADHLTVNIQFGATVVPSESTGYAIGLTGNNISFNNDGTVEASRDTVGRAKSAVFIGNSNSSIHTITNRGSLVGTFGHDLSSVDGVALAIHNGTVGSTTIRNNGDIQAKAINGSTSAAADAPVIIVRSPGSTSEGVGSQVRFVNESFATITGRIAFQGASQGDGNSFTNAGALSGSLHMGTGGSANHFYAVTGSTLTSAGGVATETTKDGLVFAATGTVNAGSANNGNTLTLKNATDGDGIGSGGSGGIAGDQYLNFSHLVVNGGTWNLSGNLFPSSTLNPTVVLNDGVLSTTSTALGNAVVIANGGTLHAAGGADMISNAITLKGSLIVDSSNALTLAARIDGTGSLLKKGAGTLRLDGSNTYSGGTELHAGKLLLSNNAAVGSGELRVTADATLDNSSPISMTNSVAVRAQLTVAGSQNMMLAGVISGRGSLVKNGSAILTLAAQNTYTGNTTVNAGRLQLQGNSSLASAQVTVNKNATLGGQGVLAGNVQVATGAMLAPSDEMGVNGLTVRGNLSMAQGSLLGVEQGASTSVDGNLALNGVQLAVQQANGLGLGVYRLFDYKGTLNTANRGITGIPAGMVLQYLHDKKQINLLSTQGHILSLWNASGVASTNSFGGTGVWSVGATTWSDAKGTLIGAMLPQPGFAIFTGDAGTVSVRNQDGAVQAIGMQFANDGYVMDGDTLTLVAGSTNSGPVEIRVGDGSAVSHRWHATIKNVLAGSDGLNKTGAGTLLLTAVNRYSGGTTVSAGTLSVEQDANLGQSGEAVTLNGGRLQITGTSFTSNGNRVWGLGAQGGTVDIADSANLFTLDSDLSGSGVFTKAGDGTLVLTGANSYSGGTVIDGGTLVASVANLGSGTIKTKAALQLDQGSNATLAQAIEGSGSVTKTGTGELHLTGHNTWSGGLNIDDGSVVASADSLGSGAVVNNAHLQLQQSSDATLAQAISGAGQLSKTGAGALTLTGNSSTFSGNTQVADGSLLITKNSSLGGDITVANGATLAGTGTVGSAGTLTIVQRGATINPSENAASYGTMRIAGDLRLEQGSTYYVQADPDSDSSSLLKVAGTATLGGSVLHAGTELNAKTDFQVGKTYTILEASSIQGNFGEVKSNYAYLDVALGYGTNAVNLKLERKSEDGGTTVIDFADLAQTGNQVATAQGIESLPSSHALYKFVETLPAGAPPAVFDSLSGEAHASVASGLATVGSLTSNLGSQHLYSNLTAGRRAGDPVAQSDGALPASAWPSSKALPAWAEVIGHWQRFDGDNNLGQMKQRTTGVFLGMDEKLGGSDWRVGAAVGYIHAKTDVDDRSSTIKVDNYSVAIYAGRSMEVGANHINMLGGLAYTWHDIRTERRVSSLDQTLKADYRAHTAQAFAEVGYAFGQYDQMGIEPFVGMSVSEQRIRGFSEKGGFAALEGKSSNHTLASSTLGVRLHNNIQMGEYDGRLRASLGWRHAIGSVTSDRTMAFEGGQNFTVAGVPLARDTALIELGADVSLSRYSSLGIGYKGELGNGQRDHSAQVQVRVAF